MSISADEFIDGAKANTANAEILRRLPQLDLPQCYLTAGCLFQTIWNRRSGRPPDWGVKDYDVFYFDGGDVSWDAEDVVIQRAKHLFDDLGVTVEVRNQARVHLWYEARFGATCPPLRSTKHGIDRFLIRCTSVGIDAATGELYAPDGLDDLWNGVLRPNPLAEQPELFRRKAQDYAERWPWLVIA